MIRLLKISILLFFLFNYLSSFSQGRYNDYKDNYVFSFLSKKYSSTYGISLFPYDNTKNFGICMNLISQEYQTINGLNVELIGNGIVDIFSSDNDYSRTNFQTKITSTYNGISISPLGLNSNGIVNGLSINGIHCYQTQIKGIGISFLVINTMFLNGLSLSCFSKFGLMKGLQVGIIVRSNESKGVSIGCFSGSDNGHGLIIGLFNSSLKHKGLMLGLINEVEGKFFPIIYFNFKDK